MRNLRNLYKKFFDEDEKCNYEIHFENAENQSNKIMASILYQTDDFPTEYIINGTLEDLIDMQVENFNHFRNAINELLSTKEDVITFLLQDQDLNDHFALLVPDVISKRLTKEKRT